MKLNLKDGPLALPDGSQVLTPPTPPPVQPFRRLAEEAMDHPLDLPPLGSWDLKGKTVAVLIDDWGRPTPCHEFLPAAMERLHAAGARREDITLITASGMHDPMDHAAMEKKVGREILQSYRCISHDAGDPNVLSFIGVTPLGTPVWVNRYAAHADIRITFGRVFPHIAYGYEGGYKMIVPGVSSFETIMRDHGLNFSAHSTYTSIQRNPSRTEADAIGRMVGIDLMVGFVMQWDDRPVAAFSGTVEECFARAVDFGQRRVWGAVCGEPADITILSAPEAGRIRLSQNPTYYLGMALNIAKPDGIVIADMDYAAPQKIIVEGVDMDEIPIEQLYLIHERRNWSLNPRQVQHAIKAIRGAFYYRRTFELRTQGLFLVSDSYPMRLLEKWNARQFAGAAGALSAALAVKGAGARVAVILDGAHTLPLLAYDYPEA